MVNDANCECTVLIELQVERTAVSLGGVVKSHSWIFELAGQTDYCSLWLKLGDKYCLH